MSGDITPEEFNKQTIQLLKEHTETLKAYRSVTSPDFFLTGSNIFSNYRANNNVKFLYTGEDYFAEVAKAIDNAEKTIYITGWQINYDVLLKTPEARSKKAEREKLEKELASAEEAIKKIYVLAKPEIEQIQKDLDAVDAVDIRPTVKKIMNTIKKVTEGEQFKLDLTEEKDAVLRHLYSRQKPVPQNEEPLKIQSIDIEGFNMNIVDLPKLTSDVFSEKTVEVCYTDGTCDRIEIKKLVEELYQKLKLEEKIKQLVEDANTGLKDSLWEHLRKAVLRGVKVYVMPWSCPPVGPVKTFDLDTMLAIFQLNAGLEEQRAFFTFSTLDSDMGEVAALFYSHHQKSVVVDHKIGFVGGMDLAYGRRDDKSFNLDASVRFGNDRYNPCIPHMQQALRSTHVSRMALTLSTLYNISDSALLANQINTVADIKTELDNWWNTPLSWDIAYDIRKELQPFHESFNKIIDNKVDQLLAQEVDPILSYYFTNGIDNLIFLYKILWGINAVANGYSTISVYYPLTVELNWVRIPFTEQNIPTGVNIFDFEAIRNNIKVLRGEKYVALNTIARAYKTGQPIKSTYYVLAKKEIYQLLTQTKVGQLYSEIMGLEFFKNDPKQDTKSITDTSPMSLLWHTFFLFQDRATKLKEPYYYLDKQLQPLMPTGGITLNDASQPRMPWHDIAVKISGPSVYDLSQNFVSRWNTSQARIEDECKPIDKELLLGILCWAKGLIEQQKEQEKEKQSSDLEIVIPKNIQEELAKLGDELMESKANIVWLNPNEIPQPKDIQADSDGEDSQVQIIRSAPFNMLQADFKAMQRVKERLNLKEIKKPESTDAMITQSADYAITVLRSALAIPKSWKQTDSQDAWIKAIKGSQYFLYIETQFFQGNYGLDDGYRKKDDAGKEIVSGPMHEISTVPKELIGYNVDQAIEKIDVELVDWEQLRALAEKNPREFLKVLGKISTLFGQIVQKRLLQEAFAGKDIEETDPKERNAVIEAIAQRIDLAIRGKNPYHVYLVMPVHPEGQLNNASVMHTVHLAMQTIANGQNSLIKSIQRSLCINDLMEGGKTYEQAKIAAEEIQANHAPLFTQYDNWTDYLTLLNLRTWDKFINRGITEQIYVHSKMLIADDNIAIIGSANVNDRSMAGNRDSELGAIIKGTKSIKVEIFGDGKQYPVNKAVHEFRKGIWSKIFAVDAKNVPVNPAFTGAELSIILSQPAAKATWQAIQQVATDNANQYNKVFNFIPQNDSPTQEPKQPYLGPYQIPEKKYYPLGCSIWPTWSYKNPNEHSEGGAIKAPLPFQEEFWSNGVGNSVAQYDYPVNIRGFIVALPIKWTQGENNTSSLHHYIVS